MPLGGKSSAILFVPVAHELPHDVGPLVVILARLEYKVLLSPLVRHRGSLPSTAVSDRRSFGAHSLPQRAMGALLQKI